MATSMLEMLIRSHIDSGVRAGIRNGIEQAWIDRCTGRDDPEDRCPMRPADGCACYYRAYMDAPFWRRWRMEKPTRPSKDAVLDAMISQAIEQALASRSQP